jgi:methionine synthase II (cobalamin-independent)
VTGIDDRGGIDDRDHADDRVDGRLGEPTGRPATLAPVIESPPSPLAGLGTGVGSLPGTDEREAAAMVAGESPEMPFLPELPARGAGAAMIGRACTLLVDMHVDLQPAGWRLVSSESLDEARARATLRRDLDAFEEAASTADRAIKVAVTGPLTLAAGVERPRGDKVLADHGARRELAQSLAEGVGLYAREVRARFPHAQVVVQLDEPMLPTVIAGNVPTASGFSRHRAVRIEEARESLTGVLDAARAAGAVPIVHSCASTVDIGLLRSAGADAVSLDLSVLIRPDGKGLAAGVDADAWSEAVDAGMLVFAGIVPSRDPAGRPPDAIALTRRLLTWWGWLDFDEEQASRSLSVTPTCGLAGASPDWARRALSLSRQVAANLIDEPLADLDTDD